MHVYQNICYYTWLNILQIVMLTYVCTKDSKIQNTRFGVNKYITCSYQLKGDISDCPYHYKMSTYEGNCNNPTNYVLKIPKLWGVILPYQNVMKF